MTTTTTDKDGKGHAHKPNTIEHNRLMKKLILFSTVAMTLLANGNAALASDCHVQKGESIWKIAKEYHLDFSRLLELNKHLKDADLIHPNQHINTHVDDGTGHDHEQSTGATGNATAQGKIADDAQAESDTQAAQVLELVNIERKKAGLQPLTLDNTLSRVAAEKAHDMAVNGYFSHDSPTYGTPFDMMRSFGVDYKSAGENIAAGQRSAAGVMESWMNSSGHRANILNAKYTKLGVGYYAGGSYGTYWVQEFTQ